jgi:predicted outer membrane repeat protein
MFQMGTYTNDIDISGKVVVIFGTNAVLDANQKGRFFRGDGSKGESSLELHNITLQNGNVDTITPDCGGAIYVIGSGVKLVMHGTSFISNRAYGGGTSPPTGGGGAICAYHGPDVKIYTSEFKNNSAGFGGAICAEYGANVEIHASDFKTNSASYSHGGAIYAFACDVKMYASIFESNTALEGGAVSAEGSGVTLEIHDSSFISNEATGYNRCGWCSSSAPICTSDSDCSSGQSCDSCSSGTGIYGGGAILVQGSLAGFNCSFQGNTARVGGGAVYVFDGSNVTCTGCSFNGNAGTKGSNDITRHDHTSHVTFACAEGTTGASVTMKADLEMTNPPSTRCVPVEAIY